jgi:hypothetical protein
MKKRWKARLFCLFFLSFSLTGTAAAGLWYELEDLSTGKSIRSIDQSTYHLTLMRHQIAAYKMTAHFRHKGDAPNLIWLRRYADKPTYDLPPYVENWVDKADTLPSYVGDLDNTFYIRPERLSSVGVDSFMVEAFIRYGMSPYNDGEACRLKFIIRVVEPPYAPPVIVPEPSFSPGSVNVIRWIPTDLAQIQDVYCFDKKNPTNLIKSLRRLYRRNPGDTLEAAFEGLLDGHTYGYYVKAAYSLDRDALLLYSDFTYTTQDRTPPEPVESSQAVLAGTYTVLVSWSTVRDTVSGVSEYHVYRSEGTGAETPIDTVLVKPDQPVTLTYETRVKPGVPTYYRVRAADRVGNEGEGVRTNSVTSGTAVDPNPQPGDGGDGTAVPDSAADPRYRRGPVDTLRLTLTGLEQRLRFQAARDSVLYFGKVLPLGGRVFDSGWLLLNQVMRNPSNYDEAFHVFDYSRGDTIPLDFVNGHVYHRRIIRQYLGSTDTLVLDGTIPDCFPPEDIRNLRLDASVEDPDAASPSTGYSRWHMKLTWDPATDGGSGLRGYRLYRKIIGTDTVFREIPGTGLYRRTAYTDRLADRPEVDIRNAMIRYRIASEDYVGNVRAWEQSVFEAGERALGGPTLSFVDTLSPDRLLRGPDTLFVRGSSVAFRLASFDVGPVLSYRVSVNGVETPHRNTGVDTLILQLSQETSRIKIRALYPAGRSSVWSGVKVVIRASRHPVEGLTASIDTAYWGGHIHLQWLRPSEDVLRYEILRWTDGQNAKTVGLLASSADTLKWTDYYGQDEMEDEPGDTLETYRVYRYTVRKLNLFNEMTPPSDTVSAFCNRPPLITAHEVKTENGRLVIGLSWTRPRPNLFRSDFTTVIRVFSDSTTGTAVTDTIADDDTTFTYRNVVLGRNSIFQVLEILNHDPEGRRSAWSQPYTVSFRNVDLAVLAQPLGRIFVHWGTSFVDSLRVSRFQLVRTAAGDTFDLMLSNRQSSFMDFSGTLVNGRLYSYSVLALDSLDHVVAAEVKDEICDRGSAYIPDVDPLAMRYFNSDSINVSWHWNPVPVEAGVPGAVVPVTGTRGAVLVRLQVSVSRSFPADLAQTLTQGPFPADSLNRNRRVPIPDLSNIENARLYFRVTASDPWGNPVEDLWSDDFYPVQTVIFDPVPPRVVGTVDFKSVTAYYASPDSVIRRLEWSGVGVQVPLDPAENWNNLIGNVAAFELFRGLEGGTEILIGIRPVHQAQLPYAWADTAANAGYHYRIVSVDSAGNRTSGGWQMPAFRVATPAPPEPKGKRACAWPPLAGGAAQYVVEIAMDLRHFRYAYEMNAPGGLDSLVCRSVWLADTSFICPTGWGSIQCDTTWFRIKARRNAGGFIVESGWSSPSFFAPVPGIDPKTTGAAEAGLPESFGLSQNFPNPFNASTTIRFDLRDPSRVRLTVYDVRGALVGRLVEETRQAGRQTVVWDGCDRSGRPVASGIYIAVLAAESETTGRTYTKRIKMVMIR